MKKPPSLALTFDFAFPYRRIRAGFFFMLALFALLSLLCARNARALDLEYEADMRRIHQQTDARFQGMERIVMTCYYQLATDSYVENWVQEAYRPQIDYYSFYLTYSRMNNIVLSHSMIESIYLYTYGNNRVLSTAYMFSDLDDFPNRHLFEAGYDNEGWLPSTWERPSGAGAVRIIPLSLPVTLTVPNGQIIINVGEKLLMDQIPGECDGILILDEDGEVLSVSDPEFLELYGRHVDDTEAGGESGGSGVRISRVAAGGGMPYYMLAPAASSYSWTVVAFVDATRVDAEKDVQMLWLATLGRISAAATLLLLVCLLFSHRMLKKQRGLVGHSLIASRFSREEEAVRRLLLGGVTGKTRSRPPFDREYRVVIYELGDYYEKLVTDKAAADTRVAPAYGINMILGTLRTFVYARWREHAGQDAAAPLVQRTEPDKLTVVYPGPPRREALDGMLDAVRADMDSSALSISVSEPASGEENVHACYMQALQALGNKSLHTRGSTLYFGDMKRRGSGAAHDDAPVRASGRIAPLISLDDLQAVSDKLDACLAGLVSRCDEDPESVNAAFSNILFELVKLNADSPAGSGPPQTDGTFIRLYGSDKIADKVRLVKELCMDTARSRRRSRLNSDNILAHRVDAFIQERYDKEISLMILADEFQISPSYISTLIKRELGLNFVNYINQLRVNKSVSLLKNTNLSIREIAGLCGYDDVHTYIRNFKRLHPTTPAEYRKRLHGTQA